MTKKKIIYFAHPVTHYGEEEEGQALSLIMECFGIFTSEDKDIEIFNPNEGWLKNLYDNRKKNNHPDRFSIFTEIVDACDIVVGSAYRDSMVGAGVATELDRAYENGKPAYIITWDDDCITMQHLESVIDGYSDSKMSIEETRERIKEGIK